VRLLHGRAEIRPQLQRVLRRRAACGLRIPTAYPQVPRLWNELIAAAMATTRDGKERQVELA
jgi:hypothetical protein